MSNLSGSTGEGGGGGRAPDRFTDTGYGTHDGSGNVETGAQFQKGTGYDEHGQVATSFGKWKVAYDPVTGMAVDNVTSGYDFPAQGTNDVGGGLVDVSTPAAGHSTEASPEMQRQVQEFFERRQHQQRQQPAPAAPPALAEAGEAGGSQEVEGEGGGGSAEERPDQVQPPVL